MTRPALAMVALLAAGCFAPTYSSGGLQCSVPDHKCPAGFHCASDGTCWKNGSDPAPGDAGDSAQLVADRPSFDFGAVATGQSSALVTVTIRNAGTLPSGTIDTRLDDSASFAIVSDLCAGQTLAAGATCTLAAQFHPFALGVAQTNLTVHAAPGGSVAVALTGTGVASGALQVAPTSHAFTAELVGATGPAFTFTVTNTGVVASGTLAAALAGSDSGQFQLGSDGCSGMALPAQQSCTVAVALAPTSSGAKSATLTVTGVPGGVAVAMLSGTGRSLATLTLSPATAQNFGPVVMGQPSGVLPFTVTNGGDAPSGPLAVQLAPAGAFAVVNDSCVGQSLTAGGACTLGVRFTPPSVGALTAMLTVSATPGGSTAVEVDGTGITPGDLTSSDPNEDFLIVDVGGTPGSVTLTITNTGDATTGAITTMVSGAQAGDFSLPDADNHCKNVTLDKNGQCMLRIVFQPATHGPRLATLSVTASPGGTVPIPLTGTGRDTVELDLTIAGAGSGSVTAPAGGAVSGNPTVCSNGTCMVQYYRTTASTALGVTLTAAPAAGSEVVWSLGSCNGASCVVTLGDAPTAVTGTFNIEPVLSFTTRLLGPATGTVMSDMGGISCNGACTQNVAFPTGTTVTLSATPGSAATLAHWSGACTSAAGSCMVNMSGNLSLTLTLTAYNYAFVSATSYEPGALAGLDGADLKCQAGANAAGLPGHYVAYLSSSTADALVHLTSDPMNATPRGWVRPDGLPFVDTRADLGAQKFRYPLALDETGATVALPAFTVTATADDGSRLYGANSALYCDDWSMTGNGNLVRAGCVGQGPGEWVGVNCPTTNCNTMRRLYCFGTSLTQALTFTPATGQIAFVLQGPFDPSTGISAANTMCQTEANATPLNGTTFAALLTTDTLVPATAFSGSGRWVRPDGIPLTSSAAALFDGSPLLSHLTMFADQTTASDLTAFLGAPTPNGTSTAANNCNDWGDKTSSFHAQAVPLAQSAQSGLTASATPTCDLYSTLSARVICLQTP